MHNFCMYVSKYQVYLLGLGINRCHVSEDWLRSSILQSDSDRWRWRPTLPQSADGTRKLWTGASNPGERTVQLHRLQPAVVRRIHEWNSQVESNQFRLKKRFQFRLKNKLKVVSLVHHLLTKVLNIFKQKYRYYSHMFKTAFYFETKELKFWFCRISVLIIQIIKR